MAEVPKEDKKIEPESMVPPLNPDQITLRVVSQDGGEVLFRTKKTTPLERLMKAYCNRMAVSMNAIRFLFDGNRIQNDFTPEQLGMQDRDMIDVVLQQVGGTSS